MMQKFPHGKNKGKSKVIKTPTFNKNNNNKSHLKCYTCEDPRHFSKDCLEYVGRKGKKVKSKNVNMVTMGNTEDGYGRPGFFHFDGEWSHTSVHGVNIVDLKFTLGKIM
ncbi:hypothetical protein PAHAL_5G306900 [Panicum hallii]|uniref:CCHC-type domain-containing protein n=1 Tax=Panicum hallii TaxID=206008 RepID=A0A2S3HVA0_9POAL|nr:hypothetical protein PAHAL_5G306900 [Panicum hallii]